MKGALLLVALAAHGAGANPASSCRDLAAKPYAKLAGKVRDKFYVGGWETAKKWPVYVVTVTLGRAPHLAREILADCPGVTRIDEPMPIDARHFSAEVTIHVASFATLTRILQLPAVNGMYVRDPTLKPPPPMPRHMDRR